MTSAKEGNSLFIVESSKRLIELLTRGIAHAADSQQGLIQFTRKLVAITETAYTLQNLHTVKEASDLLLTISMSQAQSAGLWHQAIIKKREGQLSEAIRNLEYLIADHQAEPIYRARALHTLGNSYYENRNMEAARKLYCEAGQYIRRAAPQNAYIFARSIILHSLTRAEEGDNRQALKELLSIESLVHNLRHPLLTGYYCNNVAVELLELNHVQEAASYSRVACSSALAFAYPEWKETALEIEQHTTNKSLVAVAVSAEPEHQTRPAQPKFLLVVFRFSPPIRISLPVAFRQRITCNNPTIALVVLVARIRAPSI